MQRVIHFGANVRVCVECRTAQRTAPRFVSTKAALCGKLAQQTHTHTAAPNTIRQQRKTFYSAFVSCLPLRSARTTNRSRDGMSLPRMTRTHKKCVSKLLYTRTRIVYEADSLKGHSVFYFGLDTAHTNCRIMYINTRVVVKCLGFVCHVDSHYSAEMNAIHVKQQ